MQVPNLGVNNSALPSQNKVEATASPAGNASAPSAAAPSNGYLPSSELMQLVSLARQQPEVRDDQVQAAVQRLQQGYYQTQASAENTAAAMLAAQD